MSASELDRLRGLLEAQQLATARALKRAEMAEAALRSAIFTDAEYVKAVDERVQEMTAKHDARVTELLKANNAMLERARKAEREVDEMKRTFGMRWKADMRAIKRWQSASPNNYLEWPDHADLVVWLLEQLDAAEKRASDASWLANAGRQGGA